MKPETIIKKLAANHDVFKNLLENKSVDEYMYRPNPKSWCLLEVVCHLLDEEIEDFRERVNHILTSPELPLRQIAPHQWPEERDYLKQDFKTKLKAFLDERKKSVYWLSSLEAPNWHQTVNHPEVGPRSAQKFLVNWLAHDYQHIRQINNIHHSYLQFLTGDDLTYAGKW